MKKGSITIYLCLTLCIILSLIFACLNSARYSAGRAAVSCAADEGLFSLFSNYDRELYEKYGLLFLDGGYGSGSLRAGKLVNETVDYTERVLSPSAGAGRITPAELYGISIESADITGYTLATDSGYAPLIEQIKEIMISKIGADSLKSIEESLDLYSEAANGYSMGGEDEIDELIKKYEDQKELSEQLKEDTEKQESNAESTATHGESKENSEIEIPADFKNPIDNITKLRKLGLMAFAFPDGEGISENSIDLDDLSSRRTLNRGMGLMPEEAGGLAEKILVGEFALDFFSDFTTASEGDTLQYQIEYIIGGKGGDIENLKGVMNRLLFLRMGLNYVYLLSDAEKTAQIYETAAIISAVLLMPEGIEAIAQIERVLWAYAESMMDVKSLLAGGKVPVFKDRSTWQVSFSLFSVMDSNTDPGDVKNGLTYQEYLRLLMYMTPEKDVIARTADMIEYNRRNSDRSEFSLDMCISSFQIELQGYISGSKVTVNRSYSYSV